MPKKTNPWKEFGLETRTVHISEIDFRDRAREDYGDLDSISDSFSAVGLINFLAVKEYEQPQDGFKYKLLAGGRRLWAMIKSGIAEVPVRVYPPHTDEHTMKLIERIENCVRKDFTWEEAAKLDAEIHALQESQHGKKQFRKDTSGWSQKDTARFLNKSEASISESLKLVEMIKLHPELSKCKSLAEARKVLKAMEEKERRQKRAEAVSKQDRGDLDVIRKELAKSYIVSDVFEGLKNIPSETFDLVEIDPPYGIDYDVIVSRDGRSDKALFYNEIKPEEYPAFIEKLLTECFRVMKKNSWLIIWYAVDPWHATLYEILKKTGLKVRGVPGIWDKSKGAIWASNPNKVLASGSEFFYYASKGVPELAKPGRSNVFSFASPPAAHRIHPTERPIELMQELIKTFVKPESHVLSPFLGSGNTILAANNLDCKCMGFDLSKEYHDGFVIRVFEGKPGEYGKKKEKRHEENIPNESHKDSIS